MYLTDDRAVLGNRSTAATSKTLSVSTSIKPDRDPSLAMEVGHVELS
jgi:hypothetical protein